MEVGVDAGLVIGEGVALQMQTIPLLGQSTKFTIQKLVALSLLGVWRIPQMHLQLHMLIMILRQI